MVATAWQLLNACLPFNEWKCSMSLFIILKAIIHHKFWFLPCCQFDKIWHALLWSGPNMWPDQWLMSTFLFLYCSNGVSVSCMYLAVCLTHALLIWHALFFVVIISIELSPITLTPNIWITSTSVTKEHACYDEWRLNVSWRQNSYFFSISRARATKLQTLYIYGLWSSKVLPFLTINLGIEPINWAGNIDAWSCMTELITQDDSSAHFLANTLE